MDNIKNLSINENDYDIWYHLAWDGTFGESRNDDKLQEKNVEYTLDSVQIAKRLGCKTFVGAGSQAEYGRIEGKINNKTIENPETEYGKAKKKAGEESRKLANLLGIKHIWTRFFSVYGPFDGDNTMISLSIKEMLEGKSPEYTLGEQNWNYIYVKDAVNALFLASIYGKNNKIYCIANNRTYKLKDYITKIRDCINPSIVLKLGYKEYSDKQVMNLDVDISDLIQDTGFNPEIDFETGIKETINWYKGNR